LAVGDRREILGFDGPLPTMAASSWSEGRRRGHWQNRDRAFGSPWCSRAPVAGRINLDLIAMLDPHVS
jgi:hypothetical protein